MILGFSDVESFLRKSNRLNNQFDFLFKISLYIDDIKILQYIQEILGIGKIYEYADKAIYVVNKHSDILILIKIFEYFPLNSTKYLNYLNFKSAFELYISSPKTPEITKIIDQLKDNMNSKRTDFTMPKTHNINITPNLIIRVYRGRRIFLYRKKRIKSNFFYNSKK